MAQARRTEIPVFFYRTTMGNEPVVDWLRGLSAGDRVDLCTVQFGWLLDMPLCRPFGDGLWEVRSHLPSGRIARLLFFVDRGRIGVVHGFIKTTQKTPADDLALARRRMKEMKT